MIKSLRIILLFLCFASTANADDSALVHKLLESARSQIGRTLIYDGSYQRISYPEGDVPIARGVCTDVVIRAYRAVGTDLQKVVHEDMKNHFGLYPSKKLWGLKNPDRNIDHRRVPNLQVFFQRHGSSFVVEAQSPRLQPGDILTWNLPGKLPHIGFVSDRRNATQSRYLIIHNVGAGTQEEDFQGRFELTGHYRYHPWDK